MKFIDQAILDVQAGKGGDGCVSFRREKYIPRGGPDGGHGGRGGNVVFQATSNSSTLLDFRYKKELVASSGRPGQGGGCDGKAGPDLVVPVPAGTAVYNNKTQELLFDLVDESETVIVAKGGRGGKGNSFFVSSTRQAPKFAQEGEEGEGLTVRLELKLLADVSLVGLPNAGKSTLLSAVSQARPKVADYPFTTLQPQLGVVRYEDGDPFVMADLPGLIEGAHLGKGMGDQFLKHAERTKVLLHLVSVSPDEAEDPWERYQMIESEVKAFFDDPKLQHIHRPEKRLVALSKIDVVDEESLQQIKAEFEAKFGESVIVFSSATRKNIDQLLSTITRYLE